MGHSIREDLRFCRDRNLLRLRSLSDIDWLRIRHQGREGLITALVETGGAVRFSLDNSGWPEESQSQLQEAFRQAFGVPLNQRIDPKLLTVGTIEIYNFLLGANRLDEVAPYQKELLDDLIERELVTVVPQQVRACWNANCRAAGVPRTDDTATECEKCQQEIDEREIQRLVHNDERIRQVASEILADVTGWRCDTSPERFEKHDFYPLRNPARPDEVVCVFFNKRLSESKVSVFTRSMRPVMVVHPGGDYEHAQLDSSGVVHVGFGYALATARDDDARSRFELDCKKALADLLRMEQERVLRAARQSRDTLENTPSDYDDQKYEADVFNITRSLFPYTMRWGKANRPDGFSSLAFFEEGDLSKPLNWNWSYDAKHSKDTYDLDVSEKRKMFDYVTALFRQKILQSQGNRLGAHVIVSNSLAKAQMKSTADFLRRVHRLGKKHPELKLVFMLDRFLTTLYDRVRQAEIEFRKRWPLLPERVAERMQDVNSDGYVLLDDSSGTQIADWVLDQPEFELPADAAKISRGLEDTMTKS